MVLQNPRSSENLRKNKRTRLFVVVNGSRAHLAEPSCVRGLKALSSKQVRYQPALATAPRKAPLGGPNPKHRLLSRATALVVCQALGYSGTKNAKASAIGNTGCCSRVCGHAANRHPLSAVRFRIPHLGQDRTTQHYSHVCARSAPQRLRCSRSCAPRSPKSRAHAPASLREPAGPTGSVPEGTPRRAAPRQRASR